MSTYWYLCCGIFQLLFVCLLILMAWVEERGKGTHPFYLTRSFPQIWSFSFLLSLVGCISPKFEPFLPCRSVFSDLVHCKTLNDALLSENKGITRKRRLDRRNTRLTVWHRGNWMKMPGGCQSLWQRELFWSLTIPGGPYQTLVCLKAVQFRNLSSCSSRELFPLAPLSRSSFHLRSSLGILW